MNRRLQMVTILCAVALITSLISHGLIAWLKIETSIGDHWVIKPDAGDPSVFMAGSSLAGNGLSWEKISDALNLRIEGWGVAGSSPSEWERFQGFATQTTITIIVVSPYDLNEYFLSDFRAEVVPLGQTIEDLWQSRADWPYYKRLFSQYPLNFFRIFFPTAGRSTGVMAGVREELEKGVRAIFRVESQAGPTAPLNETVSAQEYKTEKISEWSTGRTLRRLADLRSACQGKHAFNGPKNIALLRMLRRGEKQGQVAVVVLPVSPVYMREFITREVKLKFEEALTKVQQSAPKARWVRLDQLKELNSNEYFWDLVHMNSAAQKIATEAFLGQWREFKSLQ